VLTGADLPASQRIGRMMRDMPLLARDRVRFVGERVAVVAAETAAAAEAALDRIVVEYEELPAVFDPVAAMRPDAPLVHTAAEIRAAAAPRQRVPDLPNVLSHETWGQGDMEQGFAESDVVFEHTFTTPIQHQAYVEPHAALAYTEGGVAHILSSNKVPHLLRGYLAATFERPEEAFQIELLSVGGDFGGKGSAMDIPLCILLSERTGRPVKMVMSYAEELIAANPRHAAVVTVRTGLKRDGRLWARHTTAIYNSGSYGAFKPTPAVNLPCARYGVGEYRLPHARIDSYLVYTNTVPGGHMRAPGEPQVLFAAESQLDVIAHEMGLDPYRLRLQNALVEGDVSPSGERYHGVRMRPTLERAATAADWDAPRPPYVGRGMAVSGQHASPGRYSAEVQVDGTGGVLLLTALADTGTGAHTVLRQIVAAALGLAPEAVRVAYAPVEDFPPETGVGGSRVTALAGRAALEAAEAVRARLLDAAAARLGVAADAVQWDGAGFTVPGGASVTFAEAAADAARAAGGVLAARVTNAPEHVEAIPAFNVQVAEVAVDPETGQVTVRRLTTVHDVGTVLNPILHQGQIEGAVTQGLGYALTEELRVEDGRVTSAHLGEYKLPTMADVPPLDTVLVPSGEGPGPYQAKPIGEGPNCPIAPAIANAVFDACGVRINDLPITAEKVWRGLRARAAADAPAG
jgi:CO/xanthine dehydrogenase Mo-binding subunit